MPQGPNNSKKKKKGRAPAHQNTFAFQHNPKSKTTAKILAAPNVHVCRRCHEKIEWRKQYRKYKPRTQPGTCNGCEKRNVLAAYHTICESCTRNSAKAKEIIQAELGEESKAAEGTTTATATTATNPKIKLRACAMCVKEIALPGPDDEEEEDILAGMGRISLRQRRALERQKEREEREARMEARNETNENTGAGTPGDEEEKSGGPVSEEDGNEDPFLKAVGGADQLLTGQAYQEKLLAQQQAV